MPWQAAGPASLEVTPTGEHEPPFCAAVGSILIKLLAAHIRAFCAPRAAGDRDRWFTHWGRQDPRSRPGVPHMKECRKECDKANESLCAQLHGSGLNFATSAVVRPRPCRGAGGRGVRCLLARWSCLDGPHYVTVRASAAGVSATPTGLIAGAVVRLDAPTIAVAGARANGGTDRPRPLRCADC